MSRNGRGKQLSKAIQCFRRRIGFLIDRSRESKLLGAAVLRKRLIDDRIAKFHLEEQGIRTGRRVRSPPFEAVRPETAWIKIEAATAGEGDGPQLVWGS